MLDTQQTIELAKLLNNLEDIRLRIHTELVQPALYLKLDTEVALFSNLANVAYEMRHFQDTYALQLCARPQKGG